jgi:hypothetical protein
MTARDLIQHALQELGALATSEAVSNADAQASLIRLNSLLDAWQTERLTIYNLDRTAYTLVASQASYTIGPTVGADWTCAVRPTFISHAGLLYAGSAPNVEIPMKMLTDDEYAAIRIKSVESTIPTWLYYNPTYPLGTVYLYPVPSDATAQMILYIPVPLTGGLTLDSVLTLPPAYEEAIRYNLAIRLGPMFGRPIDATVGMMAVESKATMKRSNPRVDDLRVDPAIPGSRGPAWSIFTGGQ